VGGHAAGRLPIGRRGGGDEILETGADALLANGRGIRDIAGDVLQREGLSLQAANRGVKRVEDTHNVVSTFDSTGQGALPGMAVIEGDFAIVVPNTRIELFQILK
jgi:hypothetical protein